MSTLYLIATPIGNLEDLTRRAERVFRELDVLACEDTRRTGILLERYGIARPRTMFPYHERNEIRACARVLGFLQDGIDVGLCSNAGCPGISDPGYLVTSRALAAGVQVEVIPGASSVEVALLVSGLPTSSYVFKGFSPKKGARRDRFLENERDHAHTLVFFESPYRVGRFLEAALRVYGDRRAAVCVELTKRFERVSRGFLTDLLEEFSETPVRGEVTVVIAGNHPDFCRDADRSVSMASA